MSLITELAKYISKSRKPTGEIEKNSKEIFFRVKVDDEYFRVEVSFKKLEK